MPVLISLGGRSRDLSLTVSWDRWVWSSGAGLIADTIKFFVISIEQHD